MLITVCMGVEASSHWPTSQRISSTRKLPGSSRNHLHHWTTPPLCTFWSHEVKGPRSDACSVVDRCQRFTATYRLPLQNAQLRISVDGKDRSNCGQSCSQAAPSTGLIGRNPIFSEGFLAALHFTDRDVHLLPIRLQYWTYTLSFGSKVLATESRT